MKEEGAIDSVGAAELRKKYKREFAKPSRKDAVIHLKGKKERSQSGWQWNVFVDGEEKGEQVGEH